MKFSRETGRRSKQRIDEILAENRRSECDTTVDFPDGRVQRIKFLEFLEPAIDQVIQSWVNEQKDPGYWLDKIRRKPLERYNDLFLSRLEAREAELRAKGSPK